MVYARRLIVVQTREVGWVIQNLTTCMISLYSSILNFLFHNMISFVMCTIYQVRCDGCKVWVHAECDSIPPSRLKVYPAWSINLLFFQPTYWLYAWIECKQWLTIHLLIFYFFRNWEPPIITVLNAKQNSILNYQTQKIANLTSKSSANYFMCKHSFAMRGSFLLQ